MLNSRDFIVGSGPVDVELFFVYFIVASQAIGFDPLGFRLDPELLTWFTQAEVVHGRWAMLAVFGILVPETLERMGFIQDFSWYEAGTPEYFADTTTLFVVRMALMGWAEGRRWADFIKPGCVDLEFDLPPKDKPKPDVGYPDGFWFDPMMWGRGSPEPVMVLRTKEIKNGRLAILAFIEFWFQAIYTGQDLIDNLMSHIADPDHNNIFSAFASGLMNISSVPFQMFLEPARIEILDMGFVLLRQI